MSLALWRGAKSWVGACVDLVYPRQCQLCGAVDGCDQFPYLCDTCFASAQPIHPPCCEKCGHALPGAISGAFECSNCSTMTLHFDQARASWRFQGAVRHVVHGFKYSRQPFWRDVLRKWFLTGADATVDRSSIDCLVPVPLHALRERQRGFNQAWVLSEALATKWGIPAGRRVLSRVRPTETQTHLSREERLVNLRGAFKVRRPEEVKDRRVLLVDDVLTTGSTASECARVLRQAGARSVLVFTLARG